MANTDYNYVGCDGVCALTNINFSNVQRLWMIGSIIQWEAMHAMAANIPLGSRMDRFVHSNKSIQRAITAILRMKLSVDEWA